MPGCAGTPGRPSHGFPLGGGNTWDVPLTVYQLAATPSCSTVAAHCGTPEPTLKHAGVCRNSWPTQSWVPPRRGEHVGRPTYCVPAGCYAKLFDRGRALRHTGAYFEACRGVQELLADPVMGPPSAGGTRGTSHLLCTSWLLR